MLTPSNSLSKLAFCSVLAVFNTSIGFAESHLNSTDTSAVMAPMPNPAVDRVVAKVGDTKITVGHIIAMTASLPPEQRDLPTTELFMGVLERLIQQETIAQTVNNPSQMIMLQMENERRSLLASSAIDKIAASIKATDEAINEAYQLRFASFTPGTEYQAAHILVKTEAEAKEIIAKLAEGADFAQLARTLSTGPSGPNGGNLGWFGPGRMVAPFEEAVKLLEIGGVSPPVETQFGWHVIMLNESRIPSVPSLDEIRGELEQQVWRAEFEKTVTALLEAATVEHFDLGGIDSSILLDPMTDTK